MENHNVHDVFTGQEKDKIEEIARDMGMTFTEAAYALAFAELEKNPMLIGANRTESELMSEFFNKQIRH